MRLVFLIELIFDIVFRCSSSVEGLLLAEFYMVLIYLVGVMSLDMVLVSNMGLR